MKSGLNDMQTVAEVRTLPLMGDFGGRGWEWIGNFVALGGGWLLLRKVIRWQIPLGVGIGLLVPATLMYLVDSGSQPSPGFHLFSGATLLCAFFIATDPVSAATSTAATTRRGPKRSSSGSRPAVRSRIGSVSGVSRSRS